MSGGYWPGISSAYRKPHTGWQHAAALTGGVTSYEPARAATRRIRIRWPRVAGLAVAAVVVAALLGDRLPASSSSTASPPSTVALPGLRGEHRGAPGQPAREQRGVLGQADGAVTDGTSVFDDELPGVARLDAALLDALRRAATDAEDDGVGFVVHSGWRSPAYQEHLLRDAVAQHGSEEEAARWVATPEASAHVSGDAVDVGPDDAAAWLSAHGAGYGLCQTYGNEPWHYELRPEAIDRGCPPPYADPTEDPRMW